MIKPNMMLKIKTKDDCFVNVDEDDLLVSNLIQVLRETGCDDEIPLYNVSLKIFLKILEFSKHYNKDPMHTIMKPLPHDHIPVQKWYVDYISTLQDNHIIYEVLHASTYLDIEPLQQLACAKIASLIKGKECHELKRIFGFDYENWWKDVKVKKKAALVRKNNGRNRTTNKMNIGNDFSFLVYG